MKFLHGKYPIVDENATIDREIKFTHGGGTYKTSPAVIIWEYDTGHGGSFRKHSSINSKGIIIDVLKPTKKQTQRYLEGMCRFLGPIKFTEWLINSNLLK
jgi:hypothetical protein